MDVLPQQECEVENDLQESSREIFLEQKKQFWTKISPHFQVWHAKYVSNGGTGPHSLIFSTYAKTLSDEDLSFALLIHQDEERNDRPLSDGINNDFAKVVVKEVESRVIEKILLGASSDEL